MGLVRHGRATATHAIQLAVQRSQAMLATHSPEFGINLKMGAKWCNRQNLGDTKTNRRSRDRRP